MQDFVKIRSGTNPKTALDKSVKIIWDYILFHSRNMKTEGTIHIEISRTGKDQKGRSTF